MPAALLSIPKVSLAEALGPLPNTLPKAHLPHPAPLDLSLMHAAHRWPARLFFPPDSLRCATLHIPTPLTELHGLLDLHIPRCDSQ